MTKQEMNAYKRFAKECCKECGVNATMNNMVLLETGSGKNGRLQFVGDREMYIHYVMFLDRKSGKEYQCTFGAENYTADHPSLYTVR